MAKTRRHASRRLKERYNSENPDSFLRKLEKEIESGNFTAEVSYPDSTSKGYVNADGEVYEVVINNKTGKIITVLPKKSLNSEKTRKYQGRARFSLH